MSLARSLVAVLSLTLLPFATIAQAATPDAAPAAGASAINPNAPVSRAELPALIRETIMNDPDIIMDAIKKIRENEASKTQDEMSAALTKHKDELFDDTTAPVVGAKDADVTVVEFFDYHCGYCKQVLPSITKLLEKDKKVRVIFREFPILSPDSVLASRAALGVYRINKEKYFAFHTALMNHKGKYDEATLLDYAKKQGIDTAKLKAEMDSTEVTSMLDKTRVIAEDIGVRGTPAMVIGDHLMPGAMPYEDMQEAVDLTRKKPADKKAEEKKPEEKKPEEKKAEDKGAN